MTAWRCDQQHSIKFVYSRAAQIKGRVEELAYLNRPKFISPKVSMSPDGVLVAGTSSHKDLYKSRARAWIHAFTEVWPAGVHERYPHPLRITSYLTPHSLFSSTREHAPTSVPLEGRTLRKNYGTSLERALSVIPNESA